MQVEIGGLAYTLAPLRAARNGPLMRCAAVAGDRYGLEVTGVVRRSGQDQGQVDALVNLAARTHRGARRPAAGREGVSPVRFAG